MTTLTNRHQVALARGYRLQFEPTQQCHVLLYPEGMVELSETAAAILLHCQQSMPLEQVVEEVANCYEGSNVATDVRDFLKEAHARGWIAVS